MNRIPIQQLIWGESIRIESGLVGVHTRGESGIECRLEPQCKQAFVKFTHMTSLMLIHLTNGVYTNCNYHSVIMYKCVSLLFALELPWDAPTSTCQEYREWCAKNYFFSPWSKISNEPLGMHMYNAIGLEYSRTSKIWTPKIRAPPSTGQLVCPILC